MLISEQEWNWTFRLKNLIFYKNDWGWKCVIIEIFTLGEIRGLNQRKHLRLLDCCNRYTGGWLWYLVCCQFGCLGRMLSLWGRHQCRYRLQFFGIHHGSTQTEHCVPEKLNEIHARVDHETNRGRKRSDTIFTNCVLYKKGLQCAFLTKDRRKFFRNQKHQK